MTRSVPTATYRLQLRDGVDFDAAAGLVDYLARLGVSHVYLSPILTATPGSTHGYDVVDPTEIDPALGGDAGFERLLDAVDGAGLRIVLDIVPNHLAVHSPDNRWWWETLRDGPDADPVFDVDWDRGRMLLPVLGGSFDEILEAGELTVGEARGEPALRYHDRAFPLRPGSLDQSDGDLRALHDLQHYELADWRRAETRFDYRRFFDIKELGGVRVEDEPVFDLLHRRTLELVGDPRVTGLRIDHPDGLRDPAGYFERLRLAAGDDVWIVAEKILEGDETRRDWPIDGTVGYRFATQVLGLFVDPASEPWLDDLYLGIEGRRVSPASERRRAKRQVLEQLFAPELGRLVDRLEAAAAHEAVELHDERLTDERQRRALLRVRLRETLIEALVAFPVYRTYVRPDAVDRPDGDAAPAPGAVVSAEDRALIDEVAASVLARAPEDRALVELLRDVLLLRRGGPAGAEAAVRFQQLSGPVTAKGVEDTFFYRYLRFVALNDVGGDPARVGRPVGAFHEANQRRADRWPATMLTTSTHDTKRSEDVRARLAVLSEAPLAWVDAVTRWRESCAPLRGERGPDPVSEYLAYQTALGAWPISGQRLGDYLVKAAREAKRETSWLDQDEAFEADLRRFAHALVEHEPFLEILEDLLPTVVTAGRVTSLAQTLLRLTSPGVPDTYRGCELWDLSLVDPDNRRPVDWELRRQVLDEVGDDPDPGRLLANMERGDPKLWTIRQALDVRRRRPGAFLGAYLPLWARGRRAAHVVAFERGGQVVSVAPRLVLRLGRFGDWSWDDTTLELPDGNWRCALTGTEHGGGPQPLGALLERFPVALLERAA